MTGAPAGWYPDPGGQPGLYRFWDGAGWSVATSANPAAPAPGTPVPNRPPSPTYGSVRRRSTAGWFIAAAALLVVVVVVVVIAVRSLGGGTEVAGPGPDPSSSGATTCPDAVQASATPAPQTGNRVASGLLSYPRLAPPFGAPAWDRRVPFGRDVQNQSAPVELGSDGTATWVAAVLIARLLAGDGFFGPQQGSEVVAACVIGRFYGDAAVGRADQRTEAITVDGHPAWTIESHLSFQIPDIKTTGETMIIVVVDTGQGEAGLFYASVPDTSPQFMKPARQALAGLKVG